MLKEVFYSRFSCRSTEISVIQAFLLNGETVFIEDFEECVKRVYAFGIALGSGYLVEFGEAVVLDKMFGHFSHGSLVVDSDVVHLGDILVDAYSRDTGSLDPAVYPLNDLSVIYSIGEKYRTIKAGKVSKTENIVFA